MEEYLADEPCTMAGDAVYAPPAANNVQSQVQRTRSELDQLLQKPQELENLIRRYFHKLARLVPNHREKAFLYEDIGTLAQSLATQLAVDPGIFGDMSQMFWRFDFDGDAMLSEEETVNMGLCMMWTYRNAMSPPKEGEVRLKGIEHRKFADKYTIIKKLGQGGQGAVFLAKSSLFTAQVVVKMYDKSNPNAPLEDITKEFSMLKKLKHPRIARVFDIFQDEANIYVVQEPYFGGDLTTAVRRAYDAGIIVDERWLARVISQVLQGVAFLHENRVMHCDLKEANVMIVGSGTQDLVAPQIVVIDFGLANGFAIKSHPGGTPGYMPPEVWDHGLWTPKGDVFSLGVMMYSMRTGRQPFWEGCSTLEDIKRETRVRDVRLPAGSQVLQDLVRCMMEKTFSWRPTIRCIQENPWFSCSLEGQALSEDTLKSLTGREHKTDLQKALLLEMASNQNLAQMTELNELFLQLDVDNDGIIMATELRTALKGKWTEERIDALIDALSADDERGVSYELFMGQLMATIAPVENELLQRLFHEMDRGGKGYLNLLDIEALLQRPAVATVLGDRDPKELMKDMNADGAGKVSFKAFKRVMQGRQGKRQMVWNFLFNPRMQGWEVGTELEYYSPSAGQWVPCVVTKVDQSSGAVQVDCQPGYWFHGADLRRLRRASRGGLLGMLYAVSSSLTLGMASCAFRDRCSSRVRQETFDVAAPSPFSTPPPQQVTL